MGLTVERRLWYWLAFVAVLSTLNYAGRFAGGGTDSNILYTWSAAIGAVIQYGIVLGLMLLIARGLPTRETFALEPPASWGRAIALLVGVLVGVLVAAAVLAQFLNAGEEQGLVPDKWDASRAAPFVANAVAVIVIAPVVEELTFRGLGFTLLRRYGEWAAIILVGIAFALVHGLVEGFPLLALLGSALAFLRARTGSIYPAMILHATFNAFALIGSVAT